MDAYVPVMREIGEFWLSDDSEIDRSPVEAMLNVVADNNPDADATYTAELPTGKKITVRIEFEDVDPEELIARGKELMARGRRLRGQREYKGEDFDSPEAE